MPIHVYSFADRKLIDEVSSPALLVPRVPRLETFFSGIEEMRKLHEERGFKGKHTGKGAFSADGSLRYLGTIPSSVMTAILEVDPWFFENREKVRGFFQRHPEYAITDGAL